MIKDYLYSAATTLFIKINEKVKPKFTSHLLIIHRLVIFSQFGGLNGRSARSCFGSILMRYVGYVYISGFKFNPLVQVSNLSCYLKSDKIFQTYIKVKPKLR